MTNLNELAITQLRMIACLLESGDLDVANFEIDRPSEYVGEFDGWAHFVAGPELSVRLEARVALHPELECMLENDSIGGC
jgi:hypothetical protein